GLVVVRGSRAVFAGRVVRAGRGVTGLGADVSTAGEADDGGGDEACGKRAAGGSTGHRHIFNLDTSPTAAIRSLRCRFVTCSDASGAGSSAGSRQARMCRAGSLGTVLSTRQAGRTTMDNASEQMADVLVVGAGPTGLLLAGDLAAAGVSCTVLERRHGESNLTRAFAVHARTLELLDARSVADRLVASGQRVSSVNLFGNIDVDLSQLPTRFPFVLVTPQYTTESVLKQRAVEAGASIIEGAEVTDVRSGADGVDVDYRGPDGQTATARASYVVGADGVHSTVRQSLGLPFDGEPAVESVMLADVRLSDPPSDVLTVGSGEDGFALVVPFGDGWYRVIAWDRHRQRPSDDPVELSEVRDVTSRVLGTDHGMHDARWLSRFHSDERMVPQYRVGRVFLAG